MRCRISFADRPAARSSARVTIPCWRPAIRAMISSAFLTRGPTAALSREDAEVRPLAERPPQRLDRRLAVSLRHELPAEAPGPRLGRAVAPHVDARSRSSRPGPPESRHHLLHGVDAAHDPSAALGLRVGGALMLGHPRLDVPKRVVE